MKKYFENQILNEDKILKLVKLDIRYMKFNFKEKKFLFQCNYLYIYLFL